MGDSEPGSGVVAGDGSAGQARLREWFDRALELPAAARDAWIDGLPASEAQRAHLRRLLAADGRHHGYLDTPPLERVAQIGERVEAEGGDALVGQAIGGFRLLRVLGRGGMAMVYLAAREGCDFEQQVAVKLLRRGLYSEFEQRLFRLERRVLATLSHPDIARLIDGGVTDAGIPYLVMEYVDGDAVTLHAATHALGVRERLRLFERICVAVAAAHQRLVVHRDIKPSNILVDREGRVKLLDFGIAKLLDEEPGSGTATALPLLTPGHAAPEQYAGGPITTATDVYALGVLLHELLVGERPHDPPRPASSQVTAGGLALSRIPMSAGALRQALAGDLDNILTKTLEAEPERRYASARELGEDVARQLRGEPVLAHPPSRWYRAGKFVSRHRGAVLATTLVFAAMVAALGVASWQAQVARAQARRASEVQAFVEALFQPLEQGTAAARAPSLHELLARARERIDRERPDAPEVRADLLAMFARIEDTLGETRDGAALAQAAVLSNERAYGARDPRTIGARELHARVLRKLGDYAAARAELERVRASLRAGDIAARDHAGVLDALGALGKETGMAAAEVIALQQEALRLRESDPASTQGELATGYNNLGAAYQYARDYPQALAWYRRSLAADVPGDSLDSATTLMNIGQVQSLAGHWKDGLETLRDARAMFARIPIERHASLASLLIRLCGVEGDLELAGSAATCDAAVRMARDVHGPHHAQLAFALTRAARARMVAGDAPGAERSFESARATAAVAAGDRERLLHVIGSAQARLWWWQGDFGAMRGAMLAWIEAHPESPARGVSLAMAALACAHAPAPDCDATLDARAERELAAPTHAGSVQQLPARLALAEVAWLRHAPAAAIASLQQALSHALPELGEQHALVVQAHLLLAAMHRQAGSGDAAGRHAAQAAAGLAQLPPGHPLRARSDMYAPSR
ncbi:MAG: serine/threonine protein kinase [Lysobacteraceae bacterium]|nr:MAG: serine/threonine protein kinase [Xanthomonadaceae bacterium]